MTMKNSPRMIRKPSIVAAPDRSYAYARYGFSVTTDGFATTARKGMTEAIPAVSISAETTIAATSHTSRRRWSGWNSRRVLYIIGIK